MDAPVEVFHQDGDKSSLRRRKRPSPLPGRSLVLLLLLLLGLVGLSSVPHGTAVSTSPDGENGALNATSPAGVNANATTTNVATATSQTPQVDGLPLTPTSEEAPPGMMQKKTDEAISGAGDLGAASKVAAAEENEVEDEEEEEKELEDCEEDEEGDEETEDEEEEDDDEDDDDEEDEEEEEKEEEEDVEEQEEEADEKEFDPEYKRRGVTPSRSYGVGLKQSLVARLVMKASKALNINSSSSSFSNTTTSCNTTSLSTSPLRALRALPPKQLASLSLKLLLPLFLLYSLRHLITFKATMQTLMIISILAEIAGRLGLLKDLKLPSPPFPSSLSPSSRGFSSTRGSPIFNFELMNGKFQVDKIRLSLLTGDMTGQALATATAARKASLTAAVVAATSGGEGRGGGGRGGGGDVVTEVRHTTVYGGGESSSSSSNNSSRSSRNATSFSQSSPTATSINGSNGTSSPKNTTTSAAPVFPSLPSSPRPRAYVVTVKGDMFLSQGAYLTSLVSFLLEVARPQPGGDEFILLLESGGGAAYEYGLASAQLERLRRAGVRLTVCVDKIAASGGYMMAVVADTLIAAPFATVGSIGATTSVPVLNVGGLLRRVGIQAYAVKSGKHKGSGGMFLVGDARGDQQALAKLQEDLSKVHEAFKAHIARWRVMVDVDVVGTGEVWQGREAKTLGLVDEVMTSEEYLAWRLLTHDVIKVTPAPEGRRFPGFLLPGRGGGRDGGGAAVPIDASLGLVMESVKWMTGGRRRRELRVGGEVPREARGEEEDEEKKAMVGDLLERAASWLMGRSQPPVFC